MKRFAVAALLVVLCAGLAQAQGMGQSKVEFADYYVIFAERGSTWVPQSDQKGMEVRMEVVENLKKLLVENHEVIIAGLVNDESGAEFIMIVETQDEMGLRKAIQNSKNVANGFFKAKIYSWRAPAGLKLEMIPRQ